ncbi:hypothetical protein [Gilvimarinus algae]|uniref:Uncharacterized protein n=1 Tax=Gilvimarinus algae TaxID=3058037 RepID=A0ABT8TG95_9GAMM|nr:hypothetical protein [Gilvimarinus sp. SDUM040014]MDO3383010.1 hypothetical protein [Gilvimarinus sp. SDUM040014]
MSSSAFDAISKFCLDNDKDFPVRNQAFAIYAQKLKEAIENHKQKNGRITPAQESTIHNMMESESEIRGYVVAAERIISDIKETAIEPYKSSFNWKDYWISVSSSVLGAFFYSVLLVIMFVVAEEQIKSWVAPMVYERQSIQTPADQNSNNSMQPTANASAD